MLAGQIIATSHNLTPNISKWWFRKGNPLISDQTAVVNYKPDVRMSVSDVLTSDELKCKIGDHLPYKMTSK